MTDVGAISVGSAKVVFGAQFTDLYKDLSSAEEKITSFCSNMKESLKSFFDKISPSIKTFVDFDDQMRLVQAVTGATQEQFSALTQQAKDLGKSTSWTASQVAEGMVSLGRSGFSTDEIQSSIGSVMNLARATGTDIGTATDIAGNALRSFNLDASQMARVCDIMATTANGSAQTLEDLGQAFKYVAPIAAQSGMTIQDTSYVLGSLANFGIKGSVAGTVFKNIDLNAIGKSDKYKDLLDIKTTTGTGELKKLPDLLNEVGDKLSQMKNAEALGIIKELFGMEGITGVSIAGKNFDALKTAIYGANGAAAETAAIMDEGLGGSFRVTQSALEGLEIAIVDQLAPSLQSAAQAVTEVITQVTNFVKNNPVLIKTIGEIVGYLVAGKAAIWGVATGVSMVVKAINDGMAVVKKTGDIINFVSNFATKSASATSSAASYVVTANTAEAASNAQKTITVGAATAANATYVVSERAAASSINATTTAQTASRMASIARAAALGLVVAAVAAAVISLNSYCKAEEEASKAAADATEAAKKTADEHEQTRGDAGGLLQELTDLANKQSLTNAEFQRGCIIADQLQSIYGDLGITIDKTARSFGNLEEAQRRLNSQTAAQEIEDKRRVLSAEEEETTALDNEYKALTNSKTKGLWKSLKGVFGGQTLDERLTEISQRQREIRQNKVKTQAEIAKIQTSNPDLQDESYRQYMAAVNDRYDTFEEERKQQTESAPPPQQPEPVAPAPPPQQPEPAAPAPTPAPVVEIPPINLDVSLSDFVPEINLPATPAPIFNAPDYGGYFNELLTEQRKQTQSLKTLTQRTQDADLI